MARKPKKHKPTSKPEVQYEPGPVLINLMKEAAEGAAKDFGKTIADLDDIIQTINRKGHDLEFGAIEESVLPQLTSFENPVIWSLILMRHLGNGDNSPDSFSIEEKRYWLKVSETIGPDWFSKMERICRFLRAAETL